LRFSVVRVESISPMLARRDAGRHTVPTRGTDLLAVGYLGGFLHEALGLLWRDSRPALSRHGIRAAGEVVVELDHRRVDHRQFLGCLGQGCHDGSGWASGLMVHIHPLLVHGIVRSHGHCRQVRRASCT